MVEVPSAREGRNEPVYLSSRVGGKNGGGSCPLFHAHSHFPLGSGDTSSGMISIACCVSSLFKTVF